MTVTPPATLKLDDPSSTKPLLSTLAICHAPLRVVNMEFDYDYVTNLLDEIDYQRLKWPKATFQWPPSISDPFRSDYVHVKHSHRSIKIAADHLLTVAGHDTLTWREVFRSEDRRGDDQRNIR